MQAFIKFIKGVLKMPLYARVWLILLVVANLVVPLIHFPRLEAQVVVGTFLISGFLMIILTAISGFSRLLGLGHFLWFPLLYFLWVRLAQLPTDDFFGVWIRVLITLNAISLVIDVVDVIRYIAGDRKDIVEGL